MSLRKYIPQGRILARKWGREWYVSEDEVVDYFRRAKYPRSLHELKRWIEGASAKKIERIWDVLDDAQDQQPRSEYASTNQSGPKL